MPQGDPQGYNQTMQDSMSEADMSYAPEDPGTPMDDTIDAYASELTGDMRNRRQRFRRQAMEPSPEHDPTMHPMLEEAGDAEPEPAPVREPSPAGEVQGNNPMNQWEDEVQEDEYLATMAMYSEACFRPEEMVVFKPTGDVVEISNSNEPEIGEFSVVFPDGSTLRVSEDELGKLEDTEEAELSPDMRAAAAKFAEVENYAVHHEVQSDTELDLTTDIHGDYGDTVHDHIFIDKEQVDEDEESPPPMSEHYAYRLPSGEIRRTANKYDGWDDDEDLVLRSLGL